MQVCMDALKEVSKVWLVAKMVHTLFLSILGNKVLEERLQKAAGKRHKKQRIDPPQPATNNSPPRTKFDDMALNYTVGPPAPQVSFERSRPQTPAVTPSRDIGQNNVNASTSHSTLSPTMRTHDTFLANNTNSRNNTRPTTPFNPSYSIPATPPDLYLVTRNSPTISQSLWENFQPDQLFPESTNMNFANSYGLNQQNLDPALQMPTMQTPNMGHTLLPGSQQRQQMGHRGSLGSQGVPMSNNMQQDQGWGMSPEDTWSNSSRGGPSVPTTLNVEDWYVGFVSVLRVRLLTDVGVIGTSSLALMAGILTMLLRPMGPCR